MVKYDSNNLDVKGFPAGMVKRSQSPGPASYFDSQLGVRRNRQQ